MFSQMSNRTYLYTETPTSIIEDGYPLQAMDLMMVTDLSRSDSIKAGVIYYLDELKIRHNLARVCRAIGRHDYKNNLELFHLVHAKRHLQELLIDAIEQIEINV